jgi:hypothetical protein
MKGVTVMYDYRGKILGIVISALGIGAMILERLSGITFIKKWSPHQHYYLFLWVTLLGLATIAYSKEKHDDERAKAIRLKAMQIAFLLLLVVLMSMGLIAETSGDKDFVFQGADLLVMSGLALMMHLLIFHVGLYRDENWDYEDKGLWYNLKHIPGNKWGLLLYFLAAGVALLLLNFVWI